jgi:pimeloyl-ACP methyl ester carboxylesterase
VTTPETILDELGWSDNTRMRTYGDSGFVVITLHGGPAASGCTGPIAQGLSGTFRVMEPWQRGSSDTPLTVARHVEDLHNLILTLDEPPALFGESWGAMLALVYAAAHPDSISKVVLNGCGTYDTTTRGRIGDILNSRYTDEDRIRMAELDTTIADPSERMFQRYEIIKPKYNYDHIDHEDDGTEPFDGQAHEETWNDELRLQESGAHPAEFATITAPVLMIHGDYDPHPGIETFNLLKTIIPQIEYRELARCGHSPWYERHARDEFFEVLREWLAGVIVK